MANTFEKIATVNVGSGGAATIDFTSIPSTFTDLILLSSLRVSTTNDWGYITLNGSSTGWKAQRIYSTGSSVLAQSRTDNIISGFFNDTTTTSSTFNNTQLYFPNYTSSNDKSISMDSVFENNATSAQAQLSTYLWANSAAINAISLSLISGTFVQYSTAYLYGVKNA